MKDERLTWDAFLLFIVDGYNKGEIKLKDDLSIYDLAIQYTVGRLYEGGYQYVTTEMIYNEMIQQCGKDIESEENKKTFLKANTKEA